MQHILPYISLERLIMYCIFININFPVLPALSLSHVSQSAQALYYIILHYITMVFCNLHCI